MGCERDTALVHPKVSDRMRAAGGNRLIQSFCEVKSKPASDKHESEERVTERGLSELCN